MLRLTLRGRAVSVIGCLGRIVSHPRKLGHLEITRLLALRTWVRDARPRRAEASPAASKPAAFARDGVHQATGNATRPRIIVSVCQVSWSSGTAICSPGSPARNVSSATCSSIRASWAPRQ
jgi:hypothetical protein